MGEAAQTSRSSPVIGGAVPTQFIQGVPSGQAGMLKPREGKTTQAVRRKLNAAAETLGVSLEIRRTATAAYSWPSEGRRRGKPRKVPLV